MNKLVFTLFIFCTSLLVIAQENAIISMGKSKAVPCYARQDSVIKRGFVDWECGKNGQAIDCNSELEYDEGSNTVIKRAKDNMNLAGVGKPYTGVCETCHRNGLLERRVNFVNGREDGKDTTYYKTGCPQVIRSFSLGIESGTWTYYYDSTQQEAWIMNFQDGEKNGSQTYFRENGDTSKFETYLYGVLHGPKRAYYRTGELRKEMNYAQGFLDGTMKLYNKEQVLLDEVEYTRGKKNGEAKYYYEDGTLLRTETWIMGTKSGEFKTFFYQGHLQTLETYSKGKRNGKFEEYYPDQSPKRIAIYKNDELIEDHHFDEHGNETYSFGKPMQGAEDDDLEDLDQKKKKRKSKK